MEMDKWPKVYVPVEGKDYGLIWYLYDVYVIKEEEEDENGDKV